MKNLQKGFSLIELLVVVAIIGILAAIGSVGYSKYIASAKSAAGTANVSVLAEALTAVDSETPFTTCVAGSIRTCFKAIASSNNLKADRTCGTNIVAGAPIDAIDNPLIAVIITPYVAADSSKTPATPEVPASVQVQGCDGQGNPQGDPRTVTFANNLKQGTS